MLDAWSGDAKLNSAKLSAAEHSWTDAVFGDLIREWLNTAHVRRPAQKIRCLLEVRRPLGPWVHRQAINSNSNMACQDEASLFQPMSCLFRNTSSHRKRCQQCGTENTGACNLNLRICVCLVTYTHVFIGKGRRVAMQCKAIPERDSELMMTVRKNVRVPVTSLHLAHNHFWAPKTLDWGDWTNGRAKTMGRSVLSNQINRPPGTLRFDSFLYSNSKAPSRSPPSVSSLHAKFTKRLIPPFFARCIWPSFLLLTFFALGKGEQASSRSLALFFDCLI